MTALAHPAPLARPPLPRLTRVELRKMTDTRAGFWLLLAIGLTALAAVAVTVAAGREHDQTMTSLFNVSGVTVSLLLPVIGLLAVTGEWTQRTALTTFTLVPQRGRVVAAKLLAGSALTLAALIACLLAAAAGNLFAGVPWEVDLSRVATAALYLLIAMQAGLALGLLLTRSAPAVVAYFVVPTLIGILVEAVHSLREPTKWVDLGQATTPLRDDAMGSGDWPRLGVAVAIWIGLPLALGLLRLRRRELT